MLSIATNQKDPQGEHVCIAYSGDLLNYRAT